MECTVSKPLGYVLLVSKVCGLAAVKLKRADEGWRVSVSRLTNLYGRAIIVIVWLSLLTALIYDGYVEPERTMYLQSRSQSVTTLIMASTCSALVLSEAFYGTTRMQLTVAYMARLQEINAELNQYEIPKSHSRNEWLIVLWVLIIGNFNVIINMVMLIYRIFHNGDDIIYAQFLYIAFQIEVAMMNILILQISLIHMSVFHTFFQLNDCLKHMLRRARYAGQWLDPKMNPIRQNFLGAQNNNINSISSVGHSAINAGKLYYSYNAISKKMPAIVSHLGTLYCTLRELVEQLSDCYGFVMVTIMTSFLLNFIITPYNLFLSIYGMSPDFYTTLLQVSWAVYHASNMLMIIEPCHRTYKQTNRTKHLISQLMWCAPDNPALMSELELFYKYLMAEEIVYTPMNMFKLNRSVIVTIIGSITTYLVVIIEL